MFISRHREFKLNKMKVLFLVVLVLAVSKKSAAQKNDVISLIPYPCNCDVITTKLDSNNTVSYKSVLSFYNTSSGNEEIFIRARNNKVGFSQRSYYNKQGKLESVISTNDFSSGKTVFKYNKDVLISSTEYSNNKLFEKKVYSYSKDSAVIIRYSTDVTNKTLIPTEREILFFKNGRIDSKRRYDFNFRMLLDNIRYSYEMRGDTLIKTEHDLLSTSLQFIDSFFTNKRLIKVTFNKSEDNKVVINYDSLTRSKQVNHFKDGEISRIQEYRLFEKRYLLTEDVLTKTNEEISFIYDQKGRISRIFTYLNKKMTSFEEVYYKDDNIRLPRIEEQLKLSQIPSNSK
ncbi:MAG: hypothetical protein JWQ96_3282 [Segetibacter sp.]|nr:hypothetical protein [Segetibacter sp.]